MHACGSRHYGLCGLCLIKVDYDDDDVDQVSSLIGPFPKLLRANKFYKELDCSVASLYWLIFHLLNVKYCLSCSAQICFSELLYRNMSFYLIGCFAFLMLFKLWFWVQTEHQINIGLSCFLAISVIGFDRMHSSDLSSCRAGGKDGCVDI